jgi:hypothetical protein
MALELRLAPDENRAARAPGDEARVLLEALGKALGMDAGLIMKEN